MTELADCRGIWAAMENGGPRTLDEIQMLADVQPVDSATYLHLLICNGYVVIPGVTKAGSGEALPFFKLIKWTGPEAPYADENGRLVDPNLKAKSGSQRPRGLFKAHVRLMAERLPGPFTLSEFRSVMSAWPEIRTKKFTSIWAQLKRSGEIVRDLTTYEAGALCWIYKPNPHTSALRRYFKDHVGDAVPSNVLNLAVGASNGALIRQALDLLIAEGYVITVTPVRRGVVSYRVDAPEAQQNPPVSPFTKGGKTGSPPLTKGEKTVTPDSDPRSSLDSRFHGNDEGKSDATA